jgi:hypothetical protein
VIAYSFSSSWIQRRVIFVATPTAKFGNYEEHASNIFKPGKKLITYVEPIGYTRKATGKIYEFGRVVDFIVKPADGKILTGQKGFAKVFKTSCAKLQEFMLTLTLTADGQRVPLKRLCSNLGPCKPSCCR